jgi:hypothetical protein
VVETNVQLKSSIPIAAKVEISPMGFTLKVKAEILKIFSICPKLLINAELYGIVLIPRLKKRIVSNLGSQFVTREANVPTFINIRTSTEYLWAKQQAKHAQSWPQVFSALTPSVKQA